MHLDKELFFPNFDSKPEFLLAVLNAYPDSSYVGQFPLPQGGSFTDWAADVFYVESPNTDLGHSNYFAIYTDRRGTFITNAKHVEKLLLCVYEKSDGTFLYSRYGHDFRQFDDFFCDGGWWRNSPEMSGYTEMIGRCGGSVIPKSFGVIIKDGQFYKVGP